MASAEALQYYPQSAGGVGFPAYRSTDHFRDPSSPSFLGTLIPPPRVTAFQPQSFSTSANDVFRPGSSSTIASSGGVIAANFVSNHGKIHKRAANKTFRGKGNGDEYDPQSDVVLTRTKTPPTSSMPSPLDGSKSPSSRSFTREKIKQNLRKLSQHQEENQLDVIDLSRTAEENEERSGLGISAPRLGSRSVSDLATMAGHTHRGHGRSLSHESRLSVASGPYQPTAPPFSFPIRESSRPYTPTKAYSYSGSVASDDGPSQLYNGFMDRERSRSRGATIETLSSVGERPKLRINTSGTNTRLVDTLPPIIYPAPSFSRPRRGTNQSMQSADMQTPKSKASGDRAFSFRSRAKDEPIDALTRAATIQAARQAFEDRQEAKARKYEEQEQKALDRQWRKQVKQDGRDRRRSDTQASGVRGSSWSRSETMEFASGGEYATMRSTPPARAFGEVLPGLVEVDDSTRISRKRAAKGPYFRFTTWIKTKFLHMGRRRRKNR